MIIVWCFKGTETDTYQSMSSIFTCFCCDCCCCCSLSAFWDFCSLFYKCTMDWLCSAAPHFTSHNLLHLCCPGALPNICDLTTVIYNLLFLLPQFSCKCITICSPACAKSFDQTKQGKRFYFRPLWNRCLLSQLKITWETNECSVRNMI